MGAHRIRYYMAERWLVGEVESIAKTVTDETASPHVLKFRSTQFEWGASGATYEILLFIAQWAATSLAWDATKAVARKMNDRLRGDELRPESIQPLTNEEVEGRARWLIQERYKEDITGLEVQAVELRLPDAATVELRADSGWVYEVDFDLECELVVVSRIKRRRS